jgi:hypothetical protein
VLEAKLRVLLTLAGAVAQASHGKLASNFFLMYVRGEHVPREWAGKWAGPAFGGKFETQERRHFSEGLLVADMSPLAQQ